MTNWSMQEIFQKSFQAKETVKREKEAIANCLNSDKKGHLVRTCEEGQFVECFTKQLCRSADAEQLNKCWSTKWWVSWCWKAKGWVSWCWTARCQPSCMMLKSHTVNNLMTSCSRLTHNHQLTMNQPVFKSSATKQQCASRKVVLSLHTCHLTWEW